MPPVLGACDGGVVCACGFNSRDLVPLPWALRSPACQYFGCMLLPWKGLQLCDAGDRSFSALYPATSYVRLARHALGHHLYWQVRDRLLARQCESDGVFKHLSHEFAAVAHRASLV